MTFWDIVMTILKFAGAVVVFIYGMKLMSEGLQKAAGEKMRQVLGRRTGNTASGIVTGAAVTAAIQSSTATTVMVVSFVNSGLLTLAGAIAVVMGANIGTTITSWIILLGIECSSAKFVFPLVVFAIAAPFTLMKGDKVKSISEFIIGFGILMVGLQFLQDAMPDLSQNPAILEAMHGWSDWGFWSIMIFIVVGAVLTVLIQASSAVMAITLVMTANGWIGFDVAAAIIMGQNIGTTLTANIAAMVANASGKKAARAHFVFNMVGTMLTLLVLYPELNLIAYLAEGLSGKNPMFDYRTLDVAMVPLAITLFHTFFNAATTMILAFFIPQFIKVVNWMVKSDKGEDEDDYKLTYIAGGITSTAELNIQSAQKEIEDFSKRVLRMYTFLPGLRTAKDDAEFEAILSRISKYEGITDRMEMEIAHFLTKTAEGDLSKGATRKIGSMLRIVDNLESMGDTIYQIAVTRKNKREAAVHFDEGLNANLDQMTELVQQALSIMDDNLKGDYSNINLDSAYAAEAAINRYRDMLRANHLDALRLGVYDFETGNAYSALYALYEKLGDYVINVSESIDNSRKVADSEAELQQQKEAEQKATDALKEEQSYTTKE